jgi:hypothetical protein
MKKVIFSFVFFILIFCSVASAYDLTKRVGIGFGYPYLSIKYGVNPGFSIEAKGAFGEKIMVVGGRAYCNFNPMDRTVYYLGGEVNYVKFELEEIEGEGYMGGFFMGGEIFLSRSFSFNLDFGPYYTRLEDAKSNSTVEGIDYVVNLGVHIYF